MTERRNKHRRTHFTAASYIKHFETNAARLQNEAGIDTNERVIANRAAMQHDFVPHSDVFADD